MKKNSGQALVEFILVLPVLLLILFGLIDFGNILYKKYQLEGNLNNIVDLYTDKKTNVIDEYANKNKLTVHYTHDEQFTTIEVTKNVSLMTPGLGKIMGNPYKIIVSRVVYDEG